MIHPLPNDESADGTPITSPIDEAEQQMLFTFLRQRDVPCPTCKYNLRDLQSPRCPECGRTLALRVSTLEPSATPWIITIVFLGLASGLGIPSLFFICFGALEMMQHNEQGFILGCGLIYYASSILFLLIVLAKRTAFMQMSESKQHGIAGATACVTILVILISIATIFSH